MKSVLLLYTLLPILCSAFSSYFNIRYHHVTTFRSSSIEDDVDTSSMLPPLGADGVYHISDEQEHAALLQANPDKIVVMKVFAPWCRYV